MRVAILGGGFQGCCIALALSMRGVKVSIFDRGQTLMSRTAVANEGKVHLGYMYAADRSLKTARTMIEGALSFGPFLSRALEIPQSSFLTSEPTVYLVHRESQCSADEGVDYIMKTHELIRERAGGHADLYFGQDLQAPLQRWSKRRTAEDYDTATIIAAIPTPEVAIDPLDVMARIRDRIGMDPLIDIHLEHEVEDVSPGKHGLSVSGTGTHGTFAEGFDHVVNALWEGRLAIDAKMGFFAEETVAAPAEVRDQPAAAGGNGEPAQLHHHLRTVWRGRELSGWNAVSDVVSPLREGVVLRDHAAPVEDISRAGSGAGDCGRHRGRHGGIHPQAARLRGGADRRCAREGRADLCLGQHRHP